MTLNKKQQKIAEKANREKNEQHIEATPSTIVFAYETPEQIKFATSQQVINWWQRFFSHYLRNQISPADFFTTLFIFEKCSVNDLHPRTSLHPRHDGKIKRPMFLIGTGKEYRILDVIFRSYVLNKPHQLNIYTQKERFC